MNAQLIPRERPILLNNKTCVYCGIDLETTEATKEHVVGRKFVPKGKLNKEWNLNVRACKSCNGFKSDLEDDLSAISMQADAWGRYAANDELLKAEAIRKSKNSTSRRSGKAVIESAGELSFKIPILPGLEMTVSMVSPPQADNHRVFQLAFLHVRAFAYWMTYDSTQRLGKFFRNDAFRPLLQANKSDWGNPIHRAFMRSIVEWKPCIFVSTAEDFFKIAIRKQPSLQCWSWALEWNKNCRIVGVFGDEEATQLFVQDLPSLDLQEIDQGAGRSVAFLEETRLSDEDDTLFFWDEEQGALGGSR